MSTVPMPKIRTNGTTTRARAQMNTGRTSRRNGRRSGFAGSIITRSIGQDIAGGKSWT
jgi:hypothetical protein